MISTHGCWLAVAATALLASCENAAGPNLAAKPSDSAPPEQRATLPERPNVVLIVVCTLRADHLPFYGYQKDTAPFLDRLAKTGVVFEHAHSTSGWTAPATASLHTGLYPTQHGLIYGMAHVKELQKENETIVLNRIPEKLDTIAEVLARNGYKTFAVTDNLNICEEEGFAQGFDRFHNAHYAAADGVAAKLLEWESELEAAEPYLVYLNLFDPHLPYHKREWLYPPDEPGINEPIPTRGITRDQLIAAYDS